MRRSFTRDTAIESGCNCAMESVLGEGAGVVLGASEAEVVGGAEDAADEVVGYASEVALTPAPPQAARTTATPSSKFRLRMRGPYKVAPAVTGTPSRCSWQ